MRQNMCWSGQLTVFMLERHESKVITSGPMQISRAVVDYKHVSNYLFHNQRLGPLLSIVSRTF